ncbi:MAG: UMP kinase [bacterium]
MKNLIMKKIVIKISGELLNSTDSLNQVIDQIKTLQLKYKIGIVIGAGNIFRGNQDSKNFGLEAAIGDNAGMLATIINGLILKSLLEKKGVNTKILSALPVPTITDSITQEKINSSLEKNKVIIFVGGTGNPFFTTDTNAILRALQMKADFVLKGTKVAGVFDSDPIKNKDAKLLKTINYNDFLTKNLQVMDLTAITLAKKHNLQIKVFNIFKENSLIKVLEEKDFGTLIS